MANATTLESAARAFLPPKRAWLMAAIGLLAGLGVGYSSRAIQRSLSPAAPVSGAARTPSHGSHMPTLDEMKQMADHQAAPLLAQLKGDSGDSALLAQVAAIYRAGHQFKEAGNYYQKAVEADPRNAALRTKLASSLYRSGDVDGAIAQLNEALRYEPRDANSLFDLGMIRLQGKGDGKGAVSAWQQLLKSNPNLSPDRKAEVQRLMADVLTTLANQGTAKGANRK